MNVASRSAVKVCVGVIKTRLHNRRGDSGGHRVSECRSDVSERPGVEMDVSTVCCFKVRWLYSVTNIIKLHKH